MARIIPLANVQLTDAMQIIQLYAYIYSEVQINDVRTHGEYFA